MLFIVILMVAPPVSATGQNLGDGTVLASRPAAPLANVTTTLTVNQTPIDLPATFWGTTVSPRARLLPDETDVINATPIQIIVWPGGSAGDDYDPIHDIMYTFDAQLGPINKSTGHHLGGVTESQPATSEAEFAQWCLSTGCSTIFEVPGEIDNATLAANIVNYTEKTLGLHPSYWEIGNEPEIWTHWGQSWANWTNKHHTVTPKQYALEVNSYVAAMRRADPSIRILGVAATARNNGPYNMSYWITNTTEYNGHNLSGVAFHEYPAGRAAKGTNATLQGFYGALSGPSNLTARVLQARTAVQAGCENASARWPCSPSAVPVFVTEIGSGLSNFGYGNFSRGFGGALSMAVQITQAMDLNVTNMDLFASVMNTSNSWFDFAGNERPDYTTYSQFLTRLGSQAYEATLSGFNGTLFGIATIAPSDEHRRDLLVVNTNLTSSVVFSPEFAGGTLTTPVETWQWQGQVQYTPANNTTWVAASTPGPLASYFANGLPATYTLPAQSMILFESYPTPATPVQFDSSGLPTGLRWFLDVGGNTTSTRESNLTLLLRPGSLPVTSVAVPLPIGGTERISKERLEPFVNSPVIVGSSPQVVPVPFVTQWAISLVSEPTAGGSISPEVDWANASQPLLLTPLPSISYVFGQWFGWGLGSYNGTEVPATIVPEAPVTEKAIFERGFKVNFTETGLPAGTAWSVALKGVDQFSTNSTISFFVPNGTYGFRVGNLSDYRAHPPAGSVAVNGSSVGLSVLFVKKTPPPADYSVTFNESGLPAGTNWSVSMRGGLPVSSTSSIIAFDQPNGTWGFRVSNITGYRAHPPAGSVALQGVSVNVSVVFTKNTPPPPVYPVTFNETGLPDGTTWTVTVRNVPGSSTGPTIVFDEPNGTYGFNVSFAPGYRPVPRLGSFTVNGSAITVVITFVAKTPPPPVYAVTFQETGLPNGTMWTMTVRNVSRSSTGPTIVFDEPNGTWGFKVSNMTDYRAHPPAGSVAVQGVPVSVSIVFTKNTPPPPKYLVMFVETGLPNGTEWSVAVRGMSNSSTTDTIGFRSSNGTYGFQVAHIPGYRSTPTNSSYVVEGAAINVTVTFYVPTGYPSTFVVSFGEVGLPNNTLWSVTVRNVTVSSTTSFVRFNETNGSYGFQVGVVSGFVRHPPSDGFIVQGGPVMVEITFNPVRTSYATVWKEQGLRTGDSWSVDVNNNSYPASGAWITVLLRNGTFAYAIEGPANFTPTPRIGIVQVDGARGSVSVDFTEVMFPVTFTALGLPAHLAWSVRLSHESNETTDGVQTFAVPNGTYTYDVQAPSGFYPTPSHGNVTVPVNSGPLSITFAPVGPGPYPSLWYLLSHAVAAGVVIVAAAGCGYVLVSGMRRRRRDAEP
jgi:hypothetical protein